MNFSPQRVGPQAQAIIKRDEQTLSPSYTRVYPLVVDRARGSEVWDVDGRRYLDFMAGIGVHNVGHRHPRVEAAVKEQLERYWHICLSDFYDPAALALAEKLQEISPWEESKVFFGNSGTEAVEAAIKLAMYHTGRKQFIGFFGGFHGRTLGALSFTASKAVQRAGFGQAVRVHHLPYPDPYRPTLARHGGEEYGEAIIRYLKDHIFRTVLSPDEVAAVLIEPIQGEGGYIVPSRGFFPRLREVCDEHGILLMVDEIQSGVGRSGRWWAVEHEGVQPDVICFAKGIASGLPLGGIIARKALMDWPAGSHGSTFGGNPVSSAAALATLEVIEDECLLERAGETGRYMMDALEEIQMRHDTIGDVRGRGLMVGVELVTDRKTKKRAVALRNEMIQKAFGRGLLLLPCGANAVRFIPPLNISRDLVDEGLNLFEEALIASDQRRLLN